KILTKDAMAFRARQWHILGKTVAFTNGCFDLLHAGHIASISEAANHADYLVIGLNSDTSIKNIKGPDRPLNNEQDRALVLAALSMVDAIVIFNEDTPLELIKIIKPDFLIKGGDYKVEEIAGAREVIESGGKVILNPMLEGYSTSSIIERMKQTS
ncbi:MAG TPA: D-glycero-beta-D-manno-heptose 1-phosphate adenylyltransferase, partial [Chitinophagaceae bacterium]